MVDIAKIILFIGLYYIAILIIILTALYISSSINNFIEHLYNLTNITTFNALLDENSNFANYLLLFFGLLLNISTTYYLAKICNIFKQLDKYAFKKAIFIAIVINIVLISFLFQDGIENPEDFVNFLMFLFFTSLPPAFVLHKFFGFLTKKFPVPFERIGWWSSWEFWGGLVKKILIKIELKK